MWRRGHRGATCRGQAQLEVVPPPAPPPGGVVSCWVHWGSPSNHHHGQPRGPEGRAGGDRVLLLRRQLLGDGHADTQRAKKTMDGLYDEVRRLEEE